jgi:uncharacterized Zn finger protein (UPF0148 family)
MAKFCPECGAAADGAKFCPECGTALNGGVPSTETQLGSPATAPDASEAEQEVWSGQPDRMFAPVGERSAKYVLTTERLRVESGMLRKKAESLDLWRVKDVSVKKGITQRTRKCGDVEVTSADASTPSLTLTWVSEPDELAEQIRQLASDARCRHGVLTHERY